MPDQINRGHPGSSIPCKNLIFTVFHRYMVKTSRSPEERGSGFRNLFRAENSVSGISQARNDIFIFVQFFIYCTDINLHVRMSFLQGCKSFRCCNNTHKAHAFGRLALICVMASIAEPPVASIGSSTMTPRSPISEGELAVIFHWHMGFRIAVHADVTNFAAGTMRITPSTMPNPARRNWNKASFLPEITLVLATATGVSISTSFKGRSRELPHST